MEPNCSRYKRLALRGRFGNYITDFTKTLAKVRCDGNTIVSFPGKAPNVDFFEGFSSIKKQSKTLPTFCRQDLLIN